MALLTALLFVVQVALAFIPNVELISILVVLYTLHFGRKTLIMIYGFVLLEGLFFGFGLWFINYLYVWMVLYIVTRLMRRYKGRLGWMILLAAFGFSFGLLCAIPYLFIGGIGLAFSYFVSGIPFDIIHGISNGILALLFPLMNRTFERLALQWDTGKV